MLLHTLLISPVERLLLAQGSSGPCVPPIPRHCSHGKDFHFRFHHEIKKKNPRQHKENPFWCNARRPPHKRLQKTMKYYKPWHRKQDKVPTHTSNATTGKPLLHRHSCPAPCEYLVELCQMGASRACRKDTNAGVPPPGLAPETCMSHSGYSQTWACSRVQTKRKQITALGSLLCISSCFARKRHSILCSHWYDR